MTGAAPTPTAAQPAALPRLRSDLQIELAPVRGGGFPAVIVSDPVRGSYFRLAWPESGILLLWREARDVDELRRKLAETFGVEASADAIATVANFAFSNQLTESDQAGTWKRYATLHAASRHGWFKTLIHGYLFFRVPLLHPDRLLRRLLPQLTFFYWRSFWVALLAVALLGIYLSARQWTAIVSAAQEVMRLEGLHIYAAALLGLKTIHELGHGLTTVRQGCRVPSMGVAIMLGVPVLYTDTSDSWRLPERSARLAIVFAGVAAELFVATVAILLWSFLADGLARQICFALATTSIVLSITINLNPFMRFDGYFALSDYLNIPNLQSRAFQLAIWKVREVLFDLDRQPPEHLPTRKARILITYAILTAIYRLFLFLGIAAVVYVMFGKAIGIVLGLFEIVVFVALPIAREIGAWWQMRHDIMQRRRVRWTGGTFVASAAFLFLPWIAVVEVPAVLTAAKEEAIHLPFAARLASIDVVDGQIVENGDVLFIADAADLEQQRKKALLEQRSLAFQAGRLHASDKEREGRVVVESKLARAREKVEAIERQLEQLIIRAPFSGKIVDIDPDISAGVWLNPKRQLARVVSTGSIVVKGVVSDTEIVRISSGARGVFIPDDAAGSRRIVALSSIAPASDGRLAEPILADRHGGNISSGEERGELRTRQGWFEIAFVSKDDRLVQLMRGVVRVDAETVSPAYLLWRQVARVLVREHGF